MSQNIRFLRDRLYNNAQCQDADPTIFDATTAPMIQTALAYCKACTVADLCIAVVKPQQSNYDGVVGGKVWSHGQELGSRTKVKPLGELLLLDEKRVERRLETQEQELIKSCEACGAWLTDAACTVCS